MIPLISISSLTSDAACFGQVRALRWPDGVNCPHCGSPDTIRRGKDDKQPERQRYQCKRCDKRFDDLTGTVFEGHHQPLKVWVLCLYLMSLNLSNQQIARELGLNKDDAQAMTEQLRRGVEKKNAGKPAWEC
jgi:transposase-like protein